MESEKITIVDIEGKEIGAATREEIHKKGLWHETFHCWIITIEKGKPYIHLQIRSSGKKDFPDLLDITAAGHILAVETVEDGIREVKEELGIDVAFEKLISLGVIKDQIVQGDFIDNERCHTFLYMPKGEIDDTYVLQKEEVAGMVKVDFESFYALCFGEAEEITVEGFRISAAQKKSGIQKKIGLKDLVPHSQVYLEQAATLIDQELKR